jgi:hypothetical protein
MHRHLSDATFFMADDCGPSFCIIYTIFYSCTTKHEYPSFVKFNTGTVRLLAGENAWNIDNPKGALAFSNNGEDFGLFVNWVAKA